jgi:thiol:disulfide interchange protein DsbD
MFISARTICFAIVGVLLAGPAASAQFSPFGGEDAVQSGADVVSVEMLTDHKAVAPGAVLTVGLRFEIEGDWHVYWRNPGDSGMPPRVDWRLPEGWKAGALMWPLPKRFDQPGGIAGYGYGQSVVLLSRINVPADASEGQSVEIGAEVEYLTCDDRRCVPGKATASRAVRVAAEAEPSPNQPRIDRWRAKLPDAKHLDAAAKRVNVASGRPGVTSVTVKWHSEVDDLEAFPYAEARIDVTGINVEHQNQRSAVRLRWRALAGGKDEPAGALPVLLTWADGQGERCGTVVAFPLKRQ